MFVYFTRDEFACKESGDNFIQNEFVEKLDELREQVLFNEKLLLVQERYPQLEDRRLIYEVIRRMIDKVVTDLIDRTTQNLAAENPGSIEDVRNAARPLVELSDEVFDSHASLKRFLSRSLYRHKKVRAMTDKAQTMIEVLFDRYMSDNTQMPEEFIARAAVDDTAGKARVVADYIAGMTDRFAIAEHERLI